MNVILRGQLIRTSMGRVWNDDPELRRALEFNPLLTFTCDEYVWAIKYEGIHTHELVSGPFRTRLFGAELFRKLTGRELTWPQPASGA